MLCFVAADTVWMSTCRLFVLLFIAVCLSARVSLAGGPTQTRKDQQEVVPSIFTLPEFRHESIPQLQTAGDRFARGADHPQNFAPPLPSEILPVPEMRRVDMRVKAKHCDLCIMYMNYTAAAEESDARLQRMQDIMKRKAIVKQQSKQGSKVLSNRSGIVPLLLQLSSTSSMRMQSGNDGDVEVSRVTVCANEMSDLLLRALLEGLQKRKSKAIYMQCSPVPQPSAAAFIKDLANVAE